jgi:hypothetical protein
MWEAGSTDQLIWAGTVYQPTRWKEGPVDHLIRWKERLAEQLTRREEGPANQLIWWAGKKNQLIRWARRSAKGREGAQIS